MFASANKLRDALFLDSKDFGHLLFQMTRWKHVAPQELVDHDRADLQFFSELMFFLLSLLHRGADRSVDRSGWCCNFRMMRYECLLEQNEEFTSLSYSVHAGTHGDKA
jgi:hypothetical protein